MSVTNPDGQTVSYAYDEKGREMEITYPDGGQVEYAYDALDRLIQVTGLDGSITTYEYDAAGRKIETTTDGRTTAYIYDAAGRLERLTVFGDTEISFAYTYDGNGAIASETRTEEGESIISRYTYDAAGELTGFTRTDGYEEHYDYDAAGNIQGRTRTTEDGVKTILSMAYNEVNQLIRMERASEATENAAGNAESSFAVSGIDYHYDANGNLTQKSSALGTDTYAYNALDQLISYAGYDGYQARYAYLDNGALYRKEVLGSGRRLTQEEVLEGTAIESLDPGSLLAEADLSDQSEEAAAADEDWLVTSYVYDINREYAQVLSEMTGDEAVRYEYGLERISAYATDGKTEYVYDGRGSVTEELIVGLATGTELAEQVKKVIKGYTPYGEELNTKASGFGYNGEWYDAETDMIYLRARWYEPAMGRFAQKDVESGSLADILSQNRYLYVTNDPVNYADPSGEFKIPVPKIKISVPKMAGVIGAVVLGAAYVAVNPRKVARAANAVSTMTNITSGIVNGARTAANVYRLNAIKYEQKRDKVVLGTIVDLYGLGSKMNKDCVGKSLNERLQYVCNISDDLYKSARHFNQGEEYFDPGNNWLKDERKFQESYDYLLRRLKATGGVHYSELSPQEILILETVLGFYPGNDENLYNQISVALGNVNGGSKVDLWEQFEKNGKLTTQMLESLGEWRRETDAAYGSQLQRGLKVSMGVIGGFFGGYLIGSGAIEIAVGALEGAAAGMMTDLENLLSNIGKSGGALSYAGANGGETTAAVGASGGIEKAALDVGTAIGVLQGMIMAMTGDATKGNGDDGSRNEAGKRKDNPDEKEKKTSYGESIEISDKKMYQQGQHYNKHGREMGYSSKSEYEQAARDFFENNKSTSEIYEGIWNSSRGGQSGEIQIIIRADGKQLIINKETGQIIDFYEGNRLDGFINIERVQ